MFEPMGEDGLVTSGEGRAFAIIQPESLKGLPGVIAEFVQESECILQPELELAVPDPQCPFVA
jgi:hypothetical protein